MNSWKSGVAGMAAVVMCLAAAQGAAAEARGVINGYADIAEAAYEDSLIAAQALAGAIDDFLAAPDAAGHEAAKATWKAARVPYSQTEVFRFGNAVVDAWEGRVNAWPLDEGLIDYVDAGGYGAAGGENIFAAANIIANPALQVGGRALDAGEIDESLIAAMHEIDAIEANVASGYHAIEFLLWGQDLNGTEAGAGQRPWTDYAASAACTGGNCDRRAAYLAAAARLLVADLEEMAADWRAGGAARAVLDGGSDADGLAAILMGMGSLSYGELAGERIRLGLLLNDPEEEQDCFSDNTHNSHFYNVVGIANVYAGRYERLDGSVVSGAGLSALVRARDAALDAAVRARIEGALAAAGAVKTTADVGAMAYDQMLGAGNDDGNAMLAALVDALVAQTAALEQIAAPLGLAAAAFEGSDSLEGMEPVFQ